MRARVVAALAVLTALGVVAAGGGQASAAKGHVATGRRRHHDGLEQLRPDQRGDVQEPADLRA